MGQVEISFKPYFLPNRLLEKVKKGKSVSLRFVHHCTRAGADTPYTKRVNVNGHLQRVRKVETTPRAIAASLPWPEGNFAKDLYSGYTHEYKHTCSECFLKRYHVGKILTQKSSA